ncbi:MAG: hypothetical protein J0L84_16385 [Verrucomicrobia bacterium]|nr:hypothetical protein [Verrucomicrobiota bacterium]
MKRNSCLLLLSALVLSVAARAELLSFVVDPDQTVVTLSGQAAGAKLEPQGPGGLTTRFQGTVVVDATATEVLFPGGSRVIPEEINSWEPGPDGANGSAPASYGGKATIGSGFFVVNAIAATRRLSFDVLSPPLALSGGSFDAEGVLFQFVETNNPTLDYRTSGLINLREGRILAGLATNKVAGASSLITAGALQTLTLQLDATYLFELLTPGDSSLSLSGQLVATRVIPDGPPVLVVAPVEPGSPSMTLSWPAGFKLQKSTALNPAVWGDTGAVSPAVIPFAAAGEYFQIVPQ